MAVLATGLLPDPYATWATAAVTFLTAIGVFQVDNSKKP